MLCYQYKVPKVIETIIQTSEKENLCDLKKYVQVIKKFINKSGHDGISAVAPPTHFIQKNVIKG